MKFVVGQRGSGKTVQMVHESARTGYPIVVNGTTGIYEIHKVCKYLGYTIPDDVPVPILFSDFKQKNMKGQFDGLLIDDAYNIINKLMTDYFGTRVCSVNL
ncbi:hypothetical protein F170042I7_20050 [Blautia caecimuris]|uniref:hypothetical protein n=1 Tax=Blautia caecimuris TaxID=1796615 RepID=UPI0034C126B9